MTHESEFFRAVASRNMVRVRVVAIVVNEGRLLVQRPADDPDGSYALPGGEYEVGDSFYSRLKTEFEEETNCNLVRAEFRFVTENRFRYEGLAIHNIEHYFEVEIDRNNVESREDHLQFEWLPVRSLREYDLHPRAVRDAIASGSYLHVRHLIQSSAD